MLFKLFIQYTIEEKVIERAYKKLALDALVIQQGRLAEQKGEVIFAYNFLLFILFDMHMKSLTVCIM